MPSTIALSVVASSAVVKVKEPFRVGGWPGLAGNRTTTSAWTVQLPRSETWAMPSTVCVNTLGSAVGMRSKVVPALTRMSAALMELLVGSSAAQPSARLRPLNRLNFVILFFLSFSEDRLPK